MQVPLTEFSGTNTDSGVAGRPSLGVKETKVRLTPETRARIEALVGNYKMAEFIREAVEEHLKRTEREKARSDRKP